MTQSFYVHRKLKNIIVNEIKIQLINNKPISIDLHNITNLKLNTNFVDSILNPNKFSYYEEEINVEKIIYEQQVIKAPQYFPRNRLELNDGI